MVPIGLNNFLCSLLKGMLSCQQAQNVIDGKKRIILNPSEVQRKDFETATFAEGEVYGIDILISSGEDGKVRRKEKKREQYSNQSRFISDILSGPCRRIANDDLSERFCRNISTQVEEFAYGIYRGSEEGWFVPIQSPRA